MSALIYSLKRPWWIFYCVSCSGFFLFCFVLVFFSDVGIFHQLVVNTHAFVWNSRILTGKSVFSLRLKEMFKLKKAGDFKVCSIFCENLTSWRDYLPFIKRYNHSFRTEADFNVPNCIFDVKLTSKKNNNKIKKTFSSDTSKELLVGLQTIHSWAGCELLWLQTRQFPWRNYYDWLVKQRLTVGKYKERKCFQRKYLSHLMSRISKLWFAESLVLIKFNHLFKIKPGSG